MRIYRNNWIKRIIAAGMVASMVLTTPGMAQAASTTNEYGARIVSEENLTGSDAASAEQTGGQTTESDEENGYTGNQESEDTRENTETVTTEDTQENTEADTAEDTSETTDSETTEDTQDSTEDVTTEDTSESTDDVTTEDTSESTEDATTEDTAENTEDVTTEDTSDSTENVTTEMSSEDADSSDADEKTEESSEESEAEIATQSGESPTLTLDKAVTMSGSNNWLEVEENIIKVTDGEGLVLLSNVMPEQYCSGYTINLAATTGWDITQPVSVGDTSYSFLGLGDDNNPFAGKFQLDIATAADNYSISTSKALFNALSTKATLETIIPFGISNNSQTTNNHLLAEKIVNGDTANTLSGNIVLRDLSSGSVTEAQIGGLVGTIAAGAKTDITFDNQFPNTLTVTGGSNTGLFCGTMDSGSALTATYTKGSQTGDVQVKATASKSNAGGFVGHMTGADLTVAGTSVTGVSAADGDAGGLVGRIENGKVLPKAGYKFEFAGTLTLATGSNKAAGGLIGAYENKNSDKITIDLSGYAFGSVNLSAGYDLGGLIGYYSTNNMAGSLVISGSSSENGSDGEGSTITTTGGSNANYAYGGIIGKLANNSYIEIENVKVSTADVSNASTSGFGGLVGHMVNGLLNVGNVTLSTGNHDISADNVNGHGGLIGYMEKGVLRLHGKTDLSKQKIMTAYSYTGQIVGRNDNGLVYALGDGNKLDTDGAGWELVRYSGNDRSGSDIGNWGSVVRLGDSLKESTVGTDGTEITTGVFTYDADAHTVTVNNGTGANINDVNAFAAYALAFDISSAYSGDSGSALSFKETVNPKNEQTVSLGADIDLNGTGIIGIGKDNDPGNGFTGTFDGGKNTVTLDIGTTYGFGVSDTDNAAGQVYMKRGDNRDSHYSLALFVALQNATVSNVTVKGNVSAKISKNVNQTTDIRYPGLVSALAGTAKEEVTFENVLAAASVSVTEEDNAGKLNVWQGGFLGQFEGSNLTFTNCEWAGGASLKDDRNTDNHRIGGFVATIAGGSTVTVTDSTLAGEITSGSTSNAYVGGLIAYSNGDKQQNKENSISISSLQIKGVAITTNAGKGKTSGGLLGYNWQDTKVTLGTDSSTAKTGGVTISGSTLNANQAYFGGLVYLATGYWNATAADSIVFTGSADNANTISGKSDSENPSGLLIGKSYTTKTTDKEENGSIIKITTIPSALYLEIGTFGTATGSAYKIAEDSVTININSTGYFDELVGITKYDDTKDMNAVVSLAVRSGSGEADSIDKNTNNTYINQTGTNYKNLKTRYYYNLDAFRNNSGTDFDGVTDAEKLVLWGVSQYAADPIKEYFCNSAKSDVIISGDIDLTGYSYYPVTPLGNVSLGGGAVTNLTFGNDSIEKLEVNNKKPSDPDHQHFLMQDGLLYNTEHNVTVKNVSFAGTVGKTAGTDTQYNSGALVYGAITGDPTKNPLQISLENVTLSGVRVTGMDNTSVEYAPLLINKVSRAVKLTVDSLSTGEGYADDVYAATSLIGNVGSSTATKLTLSFANIALDGRKAKATVSVYNNGTEQVDYHTFHTIFTRATLLEKFQYVPGEGSGAYNFNSTDNKVTYGVELTNTGDIGRNPDKQYQYYDGGYICDEKGAEASESYVKRRYAEANFIRYVAVQEKISENLFELDINQKATGLIDGCGTYGDPYIITSGDQLISLFNYFKAPTTVSNFQVVFNTKVYGEQKQTAESYHISGGATSDATGTDVAYVWENNKWQSVDGTETVTIDSITEDIATKYLLNAYYEISADIEIESADFNGLGTVDNPFSGVIVGKAQNTVKILCTGTKGSFSGLIAFSRGSVVKNLTLDYSAAEITIRNTDYPGLDNNYPFFGGVIGYCMGGDTIIDHVSVKYTGATISFTGEKNFLTSAGGYVGLVGGGSNSYTTEGYEKTGGGVIFRNMDGIDNDFGQVCTGASAENKTVNDEVESNTPKTTGGGGYFFRNPYVGRVLDGYVCSELVSLNNTDKNYTIPVLKAGTSDLQVTNEDGSKKVSVNSSQGLWLLSAIVNSGAGAMESSTGVYQDVDKKTIDAYQIGKPRTADYDKIGAEAGDDTESRLADEVYWGGNVSPSGSEAAKNRVSYLVKNYTTDTNAASVAGKSSAETNVPVDLTFTTSSVDMSDYGNGFRGIGSSYGNNWGSWKGSYVIKKVYRRNLLLNSINSGGDSVTAVTLKMNQNDYYSEYLNGCWRNQGAGLFVDFHYKNGCEIEHLSISGNVKVGIYDDSGNLIFLAKYISQANDKHEEEVGAGGFAARTANSWGKVTFSDFHLRNLSVYGGTSAGGVIGYTDYDQNNNFNDMVVFGDSQATSGSWTIENVRVMVWVNNNGSAGGLIGWHQSGKKLKVTGYNNDSEQNISGLTVTTIAKTDSSSVATAGGLVGANDMGPIEVSGVNAQNLNVIGQNLRDLGGFIGGGSEYGTLTISNCTLTAISVNGIRANRNGVGGVVGYNNKGLTITNVKVKGNSTVSGPTSVGGMVGKANQNLSITNCEVSDTSVYAGTNFAGGIVGEESNNITINISDVKVANINVLSKSDAGGFIGKITNGTANVFNMELVNSRIVTYGNTNCSGGVVGWLENGKQINGYNILIKDSKVGYSNVSDVKKLSEAGFAPTSKDTTGLWVGSTNSNAVIKLIAVSAKGAGLFPQTDVGKGARAAEKTIVYADKPVTQTYNPTGSAKPNASASPWLDVNPKSESEITFSDKTVMTGNAVGTGVAKGILEDLRDGNKSADRYWNLEGASSNKEYFVNFLDSTKDAYLTTYRTEESATTTVNSDIDFPILVVNNAGDVDEEIWNYIAAMTNVATGATAKPQVTKVTSTTYKWNSETSIFDKQSSASLQVNSPSKKISIAPNAYDNQSSKFTLLDVQYQNPTDTKSVFHLYIPVLVKKVLEIEFDAKFLAGTDYGAAHYPAKGQSNHYATAGFDEPLTAYIEYTYGNKDTDWQAMLDNGENLLWSYDKVLDLAKGSTAETGKKLLPADTKLTLVDRQTEQYYTYTMTGEEDVHSFNLSSMTAPDGKTAFAPVDMCDLLDIEVEGPISNTADDAVYYVKETNKENATIRKGDTYYRKATDKDTGDKYKITASKTAGCSDSYFFTIQVPSSSEYSVINNRLNYGNISRKERALPAKIISDTAKSGSSYVIYDGVEQTFEIKSHRVHNGSIMSDTVMENGDSIKIELKSTLNLTDAGKDRFARLGPSEFYHQFDINLKEYLKGTNAGTYNKIGTENIAYTYTAKSGDTVIYTKDGTISNAPGQDIVSVKNGGADLKQALNGAYNGNVVEITAEITLTYDTSDYFPVRDTVAGSTDASGIAPLGTSRIANTESQLPIASGRSKKTLEDEDRYYTADQSKAILTYSTYDGAALGDSNQQLGLNPSDEANPVDMIYTSADYDYSKVDEETLESAEYIRYKLELFQKQTDGTYNESEPLSIKDYFKDQTIIKGNDEIEIANGNSYQWEYDFNSNAIKHENERIRFVPLTGEEFEAKGFTYANYRVRLTVVLLDVDGKEIPGTKTSDYIVYTNARISQDIMESQ